MKCIEDLKKLYLNTVKLDVELQQGIYNLEKSYESKHDEIYDKRLKMLEYVIVFVWNLWIHLTKIWCFAGISKSKIRVVMPMNWAILETFG